MEACYIILMELWGTPKVCNEGIAMYLEGILIHKGPNVCMADESVLGNVTWYQFIFRFLKNLVNIHLGISFVGVQIS